MTHDKLTTTVTNIFTDYLIKQKHRKTPSELGERSIWNFEKFCCFSIMYTCRRASFKYFDFQCFHLVLCFSYSTHASAWRLQKYLDNSSNKWCFEFFMIDNSMISAFCREIYWKSMLQNGNTRISMLRRSFCVIV